LRLSATPNGKNQKSDIQKPDIRRHFRPSAANTLLLRRHVVRDTQRPASRPPTVSRNGHTTRFFTMVHQQRTAPHPNRDGSGQTQIFMPRLSVFRPHRVRSPVAVCLANRCRRDRPMRAPTRSSYSIRGSRPGGAGPGEQARGSRPGGAGPGSRSAWR
jgi:hypothetical protein